MDARAACSMALYTSERHASTPIFKVMFGPSNVVRTSRTPIGVSVNLSKQRPPPLTRRAAVESLERFGEVLADLSIQRSTTPDRGLRDQAEMQDAHVLPVNLALSFEKKYVVVARTRRYKAHALWPTSDAGSERVASGTPRTHRRGGEKKSDPIQYVSTWPGKPRGQARGLVCVVCVCLLRMSRGWVAEVVFVVVLAWAMGRQAALQLQRTVWWMAPFFSVRACTRPRTYPTDWHEHTKRGCVDKPAHSRTHTLTHTAVRAHVGRRVL
jgi:hypothetical protein